MRQEETLYTMKEIELATGIKASTLQGRRKRLGISSNRGGVHPGRGEAADQAAAIAPRRQQAKD